MAETLWFPPDPWYWQAFIWLVKAIQRLEMLTARWRCLCRPFGHLPLARTATDGTHWTCCRCGKWLKEAVVPDSPAEAGGGEG